VLCSVAASLACEFSIGQFTCLLLTVDMVAVSQAASPESNPDSVTRHGPGRPRPYLQADRCEPSPNAGICQKCLLPSVVLRQFLRLFGSPARRQGCFTERFHKVPLKTRLLFNLALHLFGALFPGCPGSGVPTREVNTSCPEGRFTGISDSFPCLSPSYL